AGLRRFRPIMMTSIAMIAGMAPVALGMGELNKARSGMGVAAIGGLISSTLLSMVVVPAFYIYLDRLRSFAARQIDRIYKRNSGTNVSANRHLQTEADAVHGDI